MRNKKKTEAEKAEARAEQARRRKARKAARGLTQVSLWVPRAAVEEAERQGLTRVGIVFAGPDDQKPGAWVRKPGGAVEPLAYVKLLFEP